MTEAPPAAGKHKVERVKEIHTQGRSGMNQVTEVYAGQRHEAIANPDFYRRTRCQSSAYLSQIDLMAKQRNYREFVLTLHLHGPKTHTDIFPSHVHLHYKGG